MCMACECKYNEWNSSNTPCQRSPAEGLLLVQWGLPPLLPCVSHVPPEFGFWVQNNPQNSSGGRKEQQSLSLLLLTSKIWAKVSLGQIKF